ncbi:MAG: DNA mismatch repair protein MutS [Anaerolineales bacterium]|nr:DNA mismatch repair protein MutS [Anaerolineales bacterium]
MSDSSETTPIRQQYLDIKSQYPDAILFFRLGDFYETFDEDAETAARELDIVLTSRKVGKNNRVPMAGIPHHAADNYIGRLIDKGYHVAVCEQIGDGPVKGLFPREVVRVVTPGTVVEPGMLPGDANNYLAAVVTDDSEVGVAYVDITTGEFGATQFEARDAASGAQQELTRLGPAEVLISDESSLPLGDLHRTEWPGWRFALDRAEESLKNHFGVATLDGFGLGGKPLGVRAAGAILDYLRETQSAAVDLLTDLATYSVDEFMVLDASTRRNLELTETLRTGERTGSLLTELDTSITPMGRRLLRQWIGKPLLELDRIESRLDQVEAFFEDGLWRTEVRTALDRLGDLERLVNRAASAVAVPRDLESLREYLQALPDVLELVSERESSAVGDIAAELDPCDEARELLEDALAEDPPATLGNLGVIRPGYDQQLDKILEDSRHAREWIDDLEGEERERTGIKSLKVGYNKVHGYYIEVTKANTDKVPEEYVRKQTLVNAERYITPDLKDYESKVLSAEEEIKELESQIFHDVCRRLSEYSSRLLQTARALARLDTVATLADVASRKGYVRPDLTENPGLEIREGRHPVVEQHLEGKRFVPNDAVFEEEEKIRIITGPNMSGKSTYLRQVALLVLMAQMGSFVPATSATIGLTDRIFTRIGAQDEIHAGQSTFMVEMVETANILHHATDRSLLILDEIGRGTSTYDGLSIAWSVVEYIHNHPNLRARTLFATHYHELTQLAEQLPGVRNYNVAVAEEGGDLVFLHKIVPGGADRSYGIHVGELAGLPRPVINRAQEILSDLETDGASGPRRSSGSRQLSLFDDPSPLLEELRALKVEAMTPLDALNKLYEWQRRFEREDGEAAEEQSNDPSAS